MIQNLNQPTQPFWNKVAAACLIIGTTITAAATVSHIQWLQVTAVICTAMSGIIPLMMPNKPTQQ